MITLCPDANRFRWQGALLTFAPSMSAGCRSGRFEILQQLTEYRLAPGQPIPRRSPPACELVTYVCEGALACETSTGGSDVMQAGEFERSWVEAGHQPSACNASRRAPARVLQISLRQPPDRLDRRGERKRYTVAQRRRVPCLVASSNAGSDALRVQPNVRIFSVVLRPGRHIVHTLGDDLRMWVHVVDGAGMLHGSKLDAGDGVGLTRMPALSFTASAPTELLLVEEQDAARIAGAQRDQGTR